MRILSLHQMVREPIGTVFSVEQFDNINDLFIKTGNHEDGKAIFHNTLIAPRPDPDHFGALEEVELAIQDSDHVIELDFDAVHSFTRRDEVNICVYDVVEIGRMIEKLTKARELLATNPKRMKV